MLEFSEVKDTNHQDFKEAMRIYTESFPSNERHPDSIIEKRVKENLYQMFIGRLDGRVVFMALLYPLRNTDFILFDYMATDEKSRNMGIGTKFVKTLVGKVKEDGNYLILEVENPEYGDNREQRKRRVKFYKRLGAKEMGNVNYILPPLSGNSPTEMILMVLPEYDDGKMPGTLVKKIITQIYEELYGRNRDDPLLNSFINSIGDTVELI